MAGLVYEKENIIHWHSTTELVVHLIFWRNLATVHSIWSQEIPHNIVKRCQQKNGKANLYSENLELLWHASDNINDATRIQVTSLAAPENI